MSDIAWMLVCGLSVAARREQAEATGRADDLQAAMAKIQQIAAGAIGMDDGDWDRPVTVGDPWSAIVCEVTLCGPCHVAVHLRIATGVRIWDEEIHVSNVAAIIQRGLDEVLLATQVSDRGQFANYLGFARGADAEYITDVVRRINNTFHQAKGGENAGAIQEEERGDRGRPGCDDHGA